MSFAATVATFGEWLPDQPALNNPGLTEALNVLPRDGSYYQFNPLESSVLGFTALATRPTGAMWANNASYTYLYAGDATSLSVREGSGWTNRSSATYAAEPNTGWSFVQFNDLVVAANFGTRPQRHTLGATTNFTLLSTSGTSAPFAQFAAKIGQFLVLGRTSDFGSVFSEDIRWSAIADPTNWPAPNSATAIAAQSGQQYFDTNYGLVRRIVGNDQFGLVFQERAITRVTYAGPPVVFQFDKISDRIGCSYPNSVVQVGRVSYFITDGGIYSTDGVSVTSVGSNRVNRWLMSVLASVVNSSYRVYGAADTVRKVIYWGFADSGATSNRPNNLLIYNYEENRFSRASQDHEILLSVPIVTGWSGNGLGQNQGRITAFNSSFVPGFFAATAGAATITTGDLELNPGGRAFVSGVKPNVESTGTAPAVTVRVGSRNDLATTPTYTATTTPTTRTGFADMRANAKYHRAEVQIVGNFEKAVGIEFKAKPAGKA